MDQQRSGTISDAPVSARAIDIYELSGIMLPGIVVACAALAVVHLAYPGDVFIDSKGWGTVPTVLALSGFFALSYLLGHVTVILGQFLFTSIIVNCLLGPPIVVLVLPHRAPCYRRSPRAAAARLFMLASACLVVLNPLIEVLRRVIEGLEPGTLLHLSGTLLVYLLSFVQYPWLWMLIFAYSASAFAFYQHYEHKVAKALKLPNRTETHSEFFKFYIEARHDEMIDHFTKIFVRRMDFENYASGWTLLPWFGKSEKFKSAGEEDQTIFKALEEECAAIYKEMPRLLRLQRFVSVWIFPAFVVNVLLRALESATLSLLLCLRPLPVYSLIKIFNNFKILRRDGVPQKTKVERNTVDPARPPEPPTSLKRLLGGLNPFRRDDGLPKAKVGREAGDVAVPPESHTPQHAESQEFEAYLAIAIDDSFRLTVSQALMNCRDATADRISRHYQMFRITHNATAALLASAILFSWFGNDLPLTDVLCLSSAVLGYALLLRSVYLCYQVYHRELYIAFGGMSRAQLKHFFPN